MSIESKDKTILDNPAFDRMIQAAKGQLRWTDAPKPELQVRSSSAQLAVARG